VAPGEVIDVATGQVLGRHEGAHAFTIGQRRGLDLRVPAVDGSPRYVVDVDVTTSTVMVGPPQLLDIDWVEGVSPIWPGRPLGAEPVRVHAQVRAHGTPVSADARLDGDRLVVELHEPIRGLALGQAIVLYDGTRVVGSATVERTRRVGL
jgi:tRNA-specific 2-thiouridylase